MLNKNIYQSIIILIIIVIAIIVTTNKYNKLYDDFIYGYWIADHQYCEEADVSSMMLFIGKYEKNKRQAYLVINNDITNQAITINYKQKNIVFNPNLKQYKVKAKIEYEEDCGMPENAIIEFNIAKGILRIHSNDTLYGLFYKNNDISNMFSDD